MPTSNTALRVSELDFLTIKENLKNFLRNQSEFQDFDFEGSGMSVLLDVLSYNTHYMGYYLNMASNEAFLDTAQLRESILSHAKHLGYLPSSRRGALARLNLTVTPSNVEDQQISQITLRKYTKFLGEDIDGINYSFVAINSNNSVKTNGVFTFSNVVVKQGEVSTIQYLMDAQNTSRRFRIPSSNVDTSTITITVQESTTNTDTKEYTLANDLTELKSNSYVYFLEEDNDLRYTFYFGDDVIGKKPKNGSVVVCTYVDTFGSEANGISNFASVEPIANLFSDNVIVTSSGSSFGGTDKETIEQVRFRAPYHYTTQNRAVTTLDYETLITKDYNNIEAVSVWGGEENIPPVYGKVYMSFKTRGNYALSNLEKESIKETLITNRNVLTIIPEIIDPEYVFLQIRGSVTYNPALTSLNSNEILQLVRAAIQDYNDKELNTFKSTFRKSRLDLYIENAEKSITGSDIRVFLQRRLELTLNQSKNYYLNYELPIRKGDFNERLSTFPQIVVKDSNNIDRNVFIEEVPQSFTGISSISIVSPGINYTSEPTVTITGDGIGATAKAFIINGKINRIEVTNRGSDYTRATVSITGGGGSQATAVAKLENKLGVLRSYYFKPNGEKVVVNDVAGSIDYNTGLVSIENLFTSEVVANDYYDENILTINVPSQSNIVRPARNRIITIDPSDSLSIQLDMVAEGQ